MRRLAPILFLAALAFVGLSGCRNKEPSRGGVDARQPSTAGDPTQSAAGSSAGLEKVTLFLNWLPEAEHGGYYAALVKGYYEQAGLDVTILPGGPNSPVVQQVARQAATFGVVNADNILLV